MKKPFILFFFFILYNKSVFSQNKVSSDTIGHIFNERINVFDTTGSNRNLIIPDNGHYVLVYRYKGFNTLKGPETKDSVKLLEEKISTILLGGMVGNLKVICLSYDRPADYKTWIETIKKEKPFKQSSKYKVEYLNLNGDKISEARIREGLFSKVTLFGPDGKFIAYSSSIAKFYYHLRDEKINIKGKIVSVDNGINEPMNDVDVHIEAGNKIDTLAKGKTDKYGDFEVKIPNNDTAYTIKANPKNKNIKNVMLLTQEGKKISYLRKSFLTFEYKLLKADILEMAEMTVKDDISLTFKKFEDAREKELVVIEDIIYGVDKYDLDKAAEEKLNKVVNVLKGNNRIKIEIISHTDSQGDDGSNLSLSEKRANAVAEYLVNNGIAKNRIVAIGKGETQLRNRCLNAVPCTNKEHGYNRRTEFKFKK